MRYLVTNQLIRDSEKAYDHRSHPLIYAYNSFRGFRFAFQGLAFDTTSAESERTQKGV